jgi:hypothetical protein
MMCENSFPQSDAKVSKERKCITLASTFSSAYKQAYSCSQTAPDYGP